MVRSGLKVDKSFKRQALAANVMNSRFSAACMDADNVENHMRTLKQKYQDIKKLMNLRGVGWNDTEKKLVQEDETYRTYVEVCLFCLFIMFDMIINTIIYFIIFEFTHGQPKAKEYLNKPIPFFDELRLVVGDDHATGDYAWTIFDQFGGTPGENKSALPPNTPLEGEPMDTENQRHEALRFSTNKTTARATRRTRTNGENGSGENIGEKIGELAASIDRSRKRTWKEKLTYVLWDMEGYSDDNMEMVYNKLINNKKEAENFYLRKLSLMKIWIDNFIASMRNSSP
ncbi:ArsR-like helix-turn-helix domain-containing protein [Dioscorea alata]|uniref:ArsR-like helix-turn-helix domain-containing protein n=1 Tax=Dioscorea alata TaxID=55571 RepID=A0ACB7TVS6_DIOAL|nr:ArsR-like helix-turn-helix domain-containing protein [Dioscorea alata]